MVARRGHSGLGVGRWALGDRTPPPISARSASDPPSAYRLVPGWPLLLPLPSVLLAAWAIVAGRVIVSYGEVQ